MIFYSYSSLMNSNAFIQEKGQATFYPRRLVGIQFLKYEMIGEKYMKTSKRLNVWGS